MFRSLDDVEDCGGEDGEVGLAYAEQCDHVLHGFHLMCKPTRRRIGKLQQPRRNRRVRLDNRRDLLRG